MNINVPTPITINANVFEFVATNGIDLKVPSSSVNTYKNADIWKGFSSITAL